MIGVSFLNWPQRLSLILAIGLSANTLTAGASAACQLENTLFSACDGAIKAKLVVLPRSLDPGLDGNRRITVTGTYSSGDRYGIEGLALEQGQIVSSRFQKWDGGLLIDANGTPKLVNVAQVSWLNKDFNLKDTQSRRNFLVQAKAMGASFIQSHLLISDGVLDTRQLENAPRFQRRILYSNLEGQLSLFDSGTRSLTLFEAARELHTEHDAHMALNLDMGSYDFCQIETEDEKQNCGTLVSASDSRLTNLLQFTIEAQ